MKNEKGVISISWRSCIKVALCAFLVYLAVYYWEIISGVAGALLGALSPVFIGFAIAYVLNILMDFYERHYFKRLQKKKFFRVTKRPVCLVASIFTLIAIVALIVILVVPELARCVKFLVLEIPPMIENLLESKFVREILPKDIQSRLSDVNWMSYVSKIMSTVSSGLGNAVNVIINAVTSVISVIVTAFLSVIFSVYMLAAKDKFADRSRRVMKNYLSEKNVTRILYTASVFDDSFHNYIVGQCTEAVILGVLCTVGMLIFRFPYAPMIGALVGFTALIPVAGAYIGAGVGALMMLTESPLKALLFLVFIVILQQLEGNIIYPKVVGNSVGLPAIFVLCAVTVGGALGGVIGMLLGVPVAAALYRLVREDVIRREKARESETELQE